MSNVSPVAQAPGQSDTTTVLTNPNAKPVDIAYLQSENGFAASHLAPDTDVSPLAIHHTLGTTGVQAAPGNHLHDARYALVGHTHAVTTIVGSISLYAGSTAPIGFLFCDGSAVSRTTYSNLFSAIGTAFGAGDGSTTFNLPDLRGRAPVGAGTGTGLTLRTLGTSLGEEAHALTAAENGAHTHGGATGAGSAHSHGASGSVATGGVGSFITSLSTSTAGAGTANGTVNGGSSASEYHSHGLSISIGSESTHTHGVSSDGSGTAHNNMQPSLVLNFIIKS